MSQEELEGICVDLIDVSGRKSRVSLRNEFLRELVALRDRRINRVNFLHILGANFSSRKSISVKVI